MKNSILFTPVFIGSVKIPNRFVRSATHDFLAAEDGSVSLRQLDLYRNLGRGGVGLIITGHAYIHRAGKASPRQLAVDEDKFIPGLRDLSAAVHESSAKIFLQLSHAGRQTKERICGCLPLAPSPVYEPTYKIMPREMSESDIEEVIQAFVKAAERAKEAGLDGVQLHCAHGYLLSSFLSSYTNRRQDRWGGNLENRVRVIEKILISIKKSVGFDFPVIAKLNSTDYLPGGLKIEEAVEVAKGLERKGLDGVEVSGGSAEAGRGSMWAGLRSKDEEGYFVPAAARIKREVNLPVIGLGGLRSFEVMEKIVSTGQVDLVAMSRPFIREPDLITKFAQGQALMASCISCNKCFNPKGISCAELKKKNNQK